MEQSDIIDTVAHHDQSVQADIYIESCVLIGIQSRSTQYIGMRGTAGHDFDPADMLADAAAFAAADLALHIDFETGFHEGEEAGAHPHGHIGAEDLAQDALDHDLAGSKRCKSL